MNAVEIEEAISLLAEQPFDAEAFPYSFLEAFGNKTTTIQRLKSGATNKSDIGGVLQTNNIHIKVSASDSVTQSLAELKASPATERAKAKFILATDGIDFEAEDLTTGETGERNGVYATNVEKKMGLKASSTCELTFGEKESAVGTLLGEAHHGRREAHQRRERHLILVRGGPDGLPRVR